MTDADTLLVLNHPGFWGITSGSRGIHWNDPAEPYVMVGVMLQPETARVVWFEGLTLGEALRLAAERIRELAAA